MGLKTAVIVVLLAILMYLCLRPTDVVLNTSVFVYSDLETVYSRVSDMQINVQHHIYWQRAIFKEEFVREDGVKTQIHEVTERLPLGLFDWKYPLVFDTVMEHTRTGQQFSVCFNLWYAGLSGNITRTLTPKVGEGGPGCVVHENMVVTTPWITSHYVSYHVKASHQNILHHMKLNIESMHEQL